MPRAKDGTLSERNEARRKRRKETRKVKNLEKELNTKLKESKSVKAAKKVSKIKDEDVIVGKKKSKVSTTSAVLRTSFFMAFDDIGGYKSLARWAKKTNGNRTEFYRMLSRLIPKEIMKLEDEDVQPNQLHGVKETELDVIIRSCNKAIK